ncbi:hypothetical protein F4815DRAFT_453984 [Daldinia loculata]|uniref:uncharacterized protein n=1 Tax=Daldinia loculata TaxID=103429 RepID=UPI0020C3783E|nr:uncharacterized protein F4817DRAFT_329933 [Daldinia loculata]KAI1649731.1 hypothetical protein F4817DRAFT_329933 [Daldinia loculata]KAI2784704.1 hypothetical protein F4815DRAFT_453984 [Daldinia loculata]
MYAVALLGLLAVPATSKALKYAIPVSLKATDCTFPANYTVSNFTIYTDRTDSSKNSTSFLFDDPRTGINTSCSRNSTSKLSGSNRWPCDDSNVAFIYQTTGIAGLTLIEAACPGNVPQFEASGLIRPDLACTNSTSGTTCVAKQSPIVGDFDSLEPAPPPSR